MAPGGASCLEVGVSARNLARCQSTEVLSSPVACTAPSGTVKASEQEVNPVSSLLLGIVILSLPPWTFLHHSFFPWGLLIKAGAPLVRKPGHHSQFFLQCSGYASNQFLPVVSFLRCISSSPLALLLFRVETHLAASLQRRVLKPAFMQPPPCPLLSLFRGSWFPPGYHTPAKAVFKAPEKPPVERFLTKGKKNLLLDFFRDQRGHRNCWMQKSPGAFADQANSKT